MKGIQDESFNVTLLFIVVDALIVVVVVVVAAAVDVNIVGIIVALPLFNSCNSSI